MSGYLIIQWPHGDRKILDHIPLQQNVGYIDLQRYRTFFGSNVDWVQADQKKWLREEGFIT